VAAGIVVLTRSFLVLSDAARPFAYAKSRLATFLKKYDSQTWLASGELQRIVAEKTKYTPQNVGRLSARAGERGNGGGTVQRTTPITGTEHKGA